jgi:hypothetical protein
MISSFLNYYRKGSLIVIGVDQQFHQVASLFVPHNRSGMIQDRFSSILFILLERLLQLDGSLQDNFGLGLVVFRG